MHRCKEFIAMSIFVLLLGTIAYASAPVVWATDGISLRQGYHIEWQRAGAMDDDGNVCYIWSDCRNGDRDVFAQKLSPTGDVLWTTNGLLVGPGYIRQEDPDVIDDGFGGFLISWVDYRADTAGDVYAQRVTSDGTLLWGEEGTPISCIPDVDQKVLHTMPDGQGGAIIVWHDTRNGDDGDLYAQHIMADGTIHPNWATNGIPAAKQLGNQGDPGQSVDTDGQGGAIIAWRDTRNTGNADIYINRLTFEGNLAWADTGGMAICTDPAEQNGVKIASDGQGGAFVVWVDKRNMATTREDLYIQHVNASGELLYAVNGIPLTTANNTQDLPRINYDHNGGAIIVWEDARNDMFNLVTDVYSQKINSAGQKQWGVNDLAICTAPESQTGVRLSADGNGAVVIAWTDDRNGSNPYSDVYAQRVTSAGTIAWQTDGIPVGSADYLQFDPLIRTQDGGNSFIAWSDSRDGSPGIYYQLLNTAGLPILTPGGEIVCFGIDGDAVNPAITKLGDSNKYIAVWQDYNFVHSNSFIYQQVFDSTGAIDFTANGKPVGIEYNNIENISGGQEIPSVISDGADGAYICWQDSRIENAGIPQVYIQRVDGQGEIQWDSSGVRVYETWSDQKYPEMVSNDEGGALVAWSGYNANFYLKIFIAEVNGDGETVNLTEITNMELVDEYINGIIPDGQGGAVLYWRGGNFFEGYYSYAARVDSDCDTLWVRTICDADSNQGTIVSVKLDNDNLIFAWSDKRNGNDFDLYVQKINLNTGAEIWQDNGILICGEPGDQIASDIEVDAQGNIYLLWSDTRNGIDNDVYVQKINSANGQKLFLASGLPVAVFNGTDQWHAQMLIDELNNIEICWEDSRFLFPDIYASYFTPSGSLYSGWSVNGDPVTSFYNRQINPIIIDDGSNGVITIWEDGRSSGKAEILNLYMQRWNQNAGVSGSDDLPIPLTIKLNQNYPNPFNSSTLINFTVPQNGNVKLTIYNSLGQEVKTLKDEVMSAGDYSVQWNGLNESGSLAASGMYFYRLDYGANMKVMKMIMLK